MQPALTQLEIAWSTVDGGGATNSSGGLFELSATIGQADVGSMTGGIYEFEGGYWPGAFSDVFIVGDCDLDGDGYTDLRDYFEFQMRNSP